MYFFYEHFVLRQEIILDYFQIEISLSVYTSFTLLKDYDQKFRFCIFINLPEFKCVKDYR